MLINHNFDYTLSDDSGDEIVTYNIDMELNAGTELYGEDADGNRGVYRDYCDLEYWVANVDGKPVTTCKHISKAIEAHIENFEIAIALEEAKEEYYERGL